MAFTPTEEHDRALQKPESIDFAQINHQLLGRVESLCEQWFPSGSRRGNEYFIGGLDGSAGKSMSINLSTGVWNDFSTDDSGGDIISLYAAIHNIKQIDSARELSGDLNILRMPVAKTKAAKVESEFEHALTDPDCAIPVNWDLGEPTSQYRYRDPQGRAVGVVLRWDNKDGTKDFRQCSWMRNKKTGECKWNWKAFEQPRTLYGVEKLAERPNAPIVVVEGEKTADALKTALSDYVVISWPGGSKAAKFANWSQLNERDVTIWPDEDHQRFKENDNIPKGYNEGDEKPAELQPGNRAATDILEALPSAKLIKTSGKHPSGWDAADAINEGWNVPQIVELIESAKANTKRLVVKFGNKERPRSLDEAKSLRPDVIIEGLLYEKSKLLIGGVAKAGKSHFAMSLSAALSRGEPFLKWSASSPQKVIYVDFELHGWELDERCASACNWNVPDNLGTLSLRKHYDIRCTNSLSKALEMIDASQANVIILDCLYKFNDSEDENDNAAMKKIGAWMDEIIAKYGITPILIHHFGKGAQGGKDVIDRFRGASSIVGEMDGLVSIVSHETDGCYIVDSVVRSFAPTAPFVAKWDYPHWEVAESLNPSNFAKPGAAKKVSDDELRCKIPVGRDRAMSFSQLGTDVTKKTFDRRISDIEGVFIVKNKNYNGKWENTYYRT